MQTSPSFPLPQRPNSKRSPIVWPYRAWPCTLPALIYEPFLDGPPPDAPPAKGIRGRIDIRDTHNGRLRLTLSNSDGETVSLDSAFLGQ